MRWSRRVKMVQEERINGLNLLGYVVIVAGQEAPFDRGKKRARVRFTEEVQDDGRSVARYVVIGRSPVSEQQQYLLNITGESLASRAALYCQLKAEMWFGSAVQVSTCGIAEALSALYGYEKVSAQQPYSIVDLYQVRETAVLAGNHEDLVNDSTLERTGLRDFLEPYVLGR